MAFLDVRGVSKAYGDVAVLHEIDIAVEAGEFLVLVGPSGCGKSTLLNLIAGLDPHGSGEIFIDGARVDALPPAERNIAMVFQSYALYPNMTVRDNLGFGLRMRGADRATREHAVGEVAALLQISDLLGRKPRELSGGQRQRVAMGRALVRKPRLFLFDEPLSNLDARLRIEMRTMIKRLHRQLGTTMVYVTHDQVEAMTLATRIAVMNEGRLQQVGTPEEVYARPANMFVASFMGAPPMNLIDAVLVREQGAFGVKVELAAGDVAMLALPARDSEAESAAFSPQNVVLGLRPEAITDARAGAQTNLQLVDNRIDLVEPTGSDTYVITKMGRADVVARLHADARPQPGETFRLAVDMTKCVLFDPLTQARIHQRLFAG